MRVALLIGVSKYDALHDLPAVENDLSTMASILRATSEYEDVHVLGGALPAEETKRRAMEFLQAYRGKEIEEALFYYSGHGDLIDSSLIYLMTDYSEELPRQTSLEDREMDSLLRELGPNVTVKIVDCCHSGTRYIKGNPELKEAVDSSVIGFNNCYFFFSSRYDQKSWTEAGDRPLSKFTAAILKSISSLPDGPARYKQIADSVSDQMADAKQEPQFSIQGSYRHVFCNVNEEIRRLASLAPTGRTHRAEQPGDAAKALAQVLANVQEEAGRCIPSVEAARTLDEIRKCAEEVSHSEVLEDFYDQQLAFPDWSGDRDLAGDEAIGKWLKGAGSDFFGWANETDPESTPLSAASYIPSYPRKPEVIGFQTSASLEYDRLFVRFKPKYPILKTWELAVLILWSPTEAAVFSYAVPLEQLSWERFDQPEKVRWQQRRFSREELGMVAQHVKERINAFQAATTRYLVGRFESDGA